MWPAESDAAGVQATDCDAANGTNPGGGGAILLLNVSVAAPTSFHYGRKKKRAEQILLEECALFPAGYKATVQNLTAGRNNGGEMIPRTRCWHIAASRDKRCC